MKTLFKSVSSYVSSNREQILMKAAVLFCIFAFVLTLIRSAVTAITYDEAYTYLFISRDNMLNPEFLWKMFSKEGCIANNHWLNSFLIFLAERLIKVNYREFSFSSTAAFCFSRAEAWGSRASAKSLNSKSCSSVHSLEPSSPPSRRARPSPST